MNRKQIDEEKGKELIQKLKDKTESVAENVKTINRVVPPKNAN